jgi:hypothetical protein
MSYPAHNFVRRLHCANDQRQVVGVGISTIGQNENHALAGKRCSNFGNLMAIFLEVWKKGDAPLSCIAK